MYDQDLKDNYPKILEITFQLFYVFIYSDLMPAAHFMTWADLALCCTTFSFDNRPWWRKEFHYSSPESETVSLFGLI